MYVGYKIVREFSEWGENVDFKNIMWIENLIGCEYFYMNKYIFRIFVVFYYVKLVYMMMNDNWWR